MSFITFIIVIKGQIFLIQSDNILFFRREIRVNRYFDTSFQKGSFFLKDLQSLIIHGSSMQREKNDWCHLGFQVNSVFFGRPIPPTRAGWCIWKLVHDTCFVTAIDGMLAWNGPLRLHKGRCLLYNEPLRQQIRKIFLQFSFHFGPGYKLLICDYISHQKRPRLKIMYYLSKAESWFFLAHSYL